MMVSYPGDGCLRLDPVLVNAVYYLYILLIESTLHQLRLVVYPIIYRVLYIQTVVVWDF